MTSVKWLTSIEAVAEPFDGLPAGARLPLQARRRRPGEPVTRIAVRALMVPPGIPDFFTRRRFVDAGPVELTGRAWSGKRARSRAWRSASTGRGRTPRSTVRSAIRLARAGHSSGSATPGEHELSCRATDAAGNVQPVEQPWNYQGIGNNLVQRVAVSVR